MAIKGENGVSDSTPGTVAVQLNLGARHSICFGNQTVQFFGKPGGPTVIVVPQIEARNIAGKVITSPDVDLDFSK